MRPVPLAPAGFLLIALSLATSPVQAQERPFTFGFSGGALLPVGELGEEYDLGIQAGAFVQSRPLGLVALRAELVFQSLTDGDHTLRNVGGIGSVVLPLQTSGSGPYLMAGIPVLQVTEDHGDHAHEGEWHVGLSAGAGYAFPLGPFGGALELGFLQVPSEEHAQLLLPITFGIRF